MGTVIGNLTLDISFGEFLWSLVIIFFMIIFFIMLFQVLTDLFRSHDVSGWAKAGWVLFLIILPFLGVLVYVIVRGRGMAERQAKAQTEAKESMDEYIRQTAGAGGGGGAAAEIAHAKRLLDEGAISQEEFEALKRKALG